MIPSESWKSYLIVTTDHVEETVVEQTINYILHYLIIIEKYLQLAL